jgi:guanylate kinase
MEELERRLRLRGTDNTETVALRLENARKEISQKDFCRHILVNDDLETATHRLMALVDAYQTDRSDG